MFLKRLKLLLVYIFILISGLACGYIAINLPIWLKPSYVEGDFRAYFPSRGTQVVVYGTQHCPYCAMTREFLKSQNIDFVDLDIEKTEKAKTDFVELKGNGVPLILIGNRRIEGFNQPIIEASLTKLGIKLIGK